MPGEAVQCLTCRAIIQSQHRHDFVWCQCPPGSDTRLFVDGGSDYLRMGGGERMRWTIVREKPAND